MKNEDEFTSGLAIEDPAEKVTMSEVKNGLVRVAIAYTGDFERDGKKFKISLDDLKSMQKNMKQREVPLDYEHLSASPTAPPGHARASGWLKSPDKIETLNGRSVLWGWAEFTPACLSAIRSREYRYFSPEIHWNAEDENGKTLGTRLAAGAITNRPFLKDLPPIEIGASDYPQLLEAVALSEHQRLVSIDSVHVPTDVSQNPKQKEVTKMKSLKAKKLADGDNKGKHGVYDGEEQVGVLDELPMDSAEMAELSALRTKCSDQDNQIKELKASVEANACDKEELTNLRALHAKAKAGELVIKHAPDGGTINEEMKELENKLGIKLNEVVDTGVTPEKQQEIAVLRELATVSPGEAAQDKAEQLLEENKLTTASFIRHQRIERKLSEALEKGKMLPSQYKHYYNLAIDNFDAVVQLLAEAKPVVDLSTKGIAGNGNEPVSAVDELNSKVKELMKETKCSYEQALTEVTRKDPGLWERHQNESRVTIPEKTRQ